MQVMNRLTKSKNIYKVISKFDEKTLLTIYMRQGSCEVTVRGSSSQAATFILKFTQFLYFLNIIC